MTMPVEQELRAAIEEHVVGVVAPADLAEQVRNRDAVRGPARRPLLARVPPLARLPRPLRLVAAAVAAVVLVGGALFSVDRALAPDFDPDVIALPQRGILGPIKMLGDEARLSYLPPGVVRVPRDDQALAEPEEIGGDSHGGSWVDKPGNTLVSVWVFRDLPAGKWPALFQSVPGLEMLEFDRPTDLDRQLREHVAGLHPEDKREAKTDLMGIPDSARSVTVHGRPAVLLVDELQNPAPSGIWIEHGPDDKPTGKVTREVWRVAASVVWFERDGLASSVTYRSQTEHGTDNAAGEVMKIAEAMRIAR